ncbi:hypothetical protein ACFSKW_12040 [Nonomuraea mangrovi]|uniref:Uncharacterized protein n=1 Tax=Nonomuraea mangrovi TaxID=2316207 RepID=A0ABW4SV10_9ACTN
MSVARVGVALGMIPSEWALNEARIEQIFDGLVFTSSAALRPAMHRLRSDRPARRAHRFPGRLAHHRQMPAALLAGHPDLILIASERHSWGELRPINGHYPPTLWPAKGNTGARPDHWGACEARRGERAPTT